MRPGVRTWVAAVLVIALLGASAPSARASIPTGGQVVLIFVGVAVIGAAIGVGVYYAVRKTPVETGCVLDGTNGRLLRTSDGTEFALAGETSGVRTGERLRVRGRRRKEANGRRVFAVQEVTKDFGPCPAAP